MVSSFCDRVGLAASSITYVNIYTRIPDALKRKGQKSWKYNHEKRPEVLAQIDKYIEITHPDALVINDAITLSHLLNEESSITLWRGCCFNYKGTRCYVLDDFLQLRTLLHASWQFVSDIKKILRYLGKDERPQPKFSYKVVEDMEMATVVESELSKAILISVDIETAGEPRYITCIGYSGLMPDGKIISYVFPFFDPTVEGNCYWPSVGMEEYAWMVVKSINANSVPKVMQGGSYDASYFVKYRIPANNYFIDCLHFFHSIWPEAPKKLNYIASITLDIVHYWKDDIKGTSDDKETKSRVPVSEQGYARYLRYNALDCYNTLLSACWLINLFSHHALSWAVRNYVNEFQDMVGPAFLMSMTGMKTDKSRQQFFLNKWLTEGKAAKKKLRIMVDDEDFNPNSPQQVASLLYDVLGAPITKRRGVKATKTKTTRPVGEDVLKLTRTKHPIYAAYIDAIWGAKKPFNNASKYGNMELYNGRFIYSLNPITKTSRYASKAHAFGYGTNAQNIPKKTRSMFIADPGYVLFNADYSACDVWFVAHESEEEKLIAVLKSDKNTHCFHAEVLFGVPYDKVFKGYKADEDWVNHPVTGIRQNTKRGTHGAHYQEAGGTLYMTMGHDEVIASAKVAGHEDAHMWSTELLIRFCDEILRKYYTFYPKIKSSFKESWVEAKTNGNRATCFGDRTHLFFGDLETNKSQQRVLSAFYGQGGTAGLIRRALFDIFYVSDLQERGMMLLTQTHDSITGQVPEDKIYLLNDILTIMQKPATIKGREFSVPVDAEVGRSWNNGMIDYRDGVTLEEIDAAEAVLEQDFRLVEMV